MFFLSFSRFSMIVRLLFMCVWMQAFGNFCFPEVYCFCFFRSASVNWFFILSVRLEVVVLGYTIWFFQFQVRRTTFRRIDSDVHNRNQSAKLLFSINNILFIWSLYYVLEVWYLSNNSALRCVASVWESGQLELGCYGRFLRSLRGELIMSVWNDAGATHRAPVCVTAPIALLLVRAFSGWLMERYAESR